MKSIQEIKMRGKIPVIVGGTNYYLETLLYDIKMNYN
jgi:tRNA A37 N6-isopentenylltransferase MiaA